MSHYKFANVKDYEHIELASGWGTLFHSVFRFVENSVLCLEFGSLHFGTVKFKVGGRWRLIWLLCHFRHCCFGVVRFGLASVSMLASISNSGLG
jgi:hypothetical protein